jgi:histone arginine demethylase JMJD6
VPKGARPAATDGVVLLGPRRSGSPPHVDPTFTAAWNWLLHGRKRWALFPPGTPRATVLGDVAASAAGYGVGDGGGGGGDGVGDGGAGGGDGGHAGDEYAQLLANGASYWWAREYPRLRARAGELGMLECVQEAGECIYVPQGWWHAVVNVSPWSIAVTHNLVPPGALPTAFAAAARKDPVFARRWRRCLLAGFADDAAAGDAPGAAAARLPADAVARCLAAPLPGRAAEPAEGDGEGDGGDRTLDGMEAVDVLLSD